MDEKISHFMYTGAMLSHFWRCGSERPQTFPGFCPRGKFFYGSRRSFNSCIARLLESLAIKKYSEEVLADLQLSFVGGLVHEGFNPNSHFTSWVLLNFLLPN